jgi:hypothetical protein
MDKSEQRGLLDDYLSEEELAAQLRKNVRTLQRWRKLRIGPPVTWNGRTPTYNVESARQWLRARETKMPRAARAKHAPAPKTTTLESSA